MEVKAGYKQTEVGVIPEDWAVHQLGAVAFLERGKFSARPRNQPRFFGGHIPFIQTGDVTNSNGSISTYTQTLNSEGLRVSKLFPHETLFFTIAANIGDVGITAFETAATDSLIAISPKTSIDKRWLYHSLKKRKKEFVALATQNAQLNINLEKLRPYPLAVPPLPEQRAIAEALSDMDALIGALDQLIAKKRDLKQATMQQLLTGQTCLPGFNGKWERRTIAQIAPLQRGFDLPTSDIKTGNFPVVYSNGVLNYHANSMAKGPGVVTGRSGTIGKVTYVEQDYWPHNTSLWVTSFKGNDPKFIFYLYTAIGFERFGTGSGVPTLNRNDVHSFELDFPSDHAEQTAIAEVLSDMDAELAALEQRRNKTRALKQGMMQELLTGRTRLV